MNILVLVHPDCLSEQYVFTPKQSEEYLGKLEEHLPKFDLIITLLMERVTDEWVASKNEEIQNHYARLMKIVQKYSNVIIRDNDLGRSSIPNEIGTLLIDHPGSHLYFSGGYQTACLRQVVANFIAELKDVIEELDISMQVYQPLVYYYSRGLGWGDDLKAPLPWWEKGWGDKFYQDRAYRDKVEEQHYGEQPLYEEYDDKRGPQWRGLKETIGSIRLKHMTSSLRKILAYENDLTEVLTDKAEEFEHRIAEELDSNFLKDIATRKSTQILTAEEFDTFDQILSEVLEIPSSKETRTGQALKVRQAYLPSIVYALKELYPELTKLITRYQIEAASPKNTSFSYRDYAEGLIQQKKRGNPRLYEKFYNRLRKEVERIERNPQEDDIIVEETQQEFDPVDQRTDLRGVVYDGAHYYIEDPRLQARWMEAANRHIENSFNQGFSVPHVTRTLRNLLELFKKQLPNKIYDRTKKAELLRRLRALAQSLKTEEKPPATVQTKTVYKPGDQVKHGWMYGIVLRLGGKQKGRQVYDVLIVGPSSISPGFEGWLVPVFAGAIKPYNFTPSEKEQEIIEDWQKWNRTRQASHVMPREPIKRNYDYTGNYLDRVKKLRKKRRKIK